MKVGKGEEQVHYDIGENIIRLSDDIIFDNENIDELISTIFYNINSNYKDKNYIRDKVILITKNMDVEKINQKILEQILEEIHEFLLADSVENKEAIDQSFYPIEFLNTLISSGMLPHKLILKKEVSIMLLHNLNPSE